MTKPSMRPLRHVRQKSGTGCGQACVAMIAGTSLRRAIRAVADRRVHEDNRDYTIAKELRAALRDFGVRLCRRIDVKNWDRISRRALVAVNYKKHSSGKETWHWVVFEPDEYGGYVMDPRTQSPGSVKRRDFRKAMRMNHYHPVTER